MLTPLENIHLWGISFLESCSFYESRGYKKFSVFDGMTVFSVIYLK